MVIRLIVGLGFLLAVMLLATGFWAWSPDLPRRQLETRYWSTDTHYLDVAGTTLRVRISGRRDAPAVLLLHGFGSSLETWEPWALLLNKDYRVVRFDLPGCGLSEPDRTVQYGDARSLQLVHGLMDQLGIDGAVLIGNSMGGRIAWRFAAAYPERVRRLVLISPDGFASPGFQYGKAPQVPAVLTLMTHFLPRRLVRSNLASAYGDPAHLSDGVLTRYYELLRAPGNRQAMLDRMKQSILEEPVPILKQIVVPTLLLWGKKDHLIPFSNSADYLRALPHANLVAFDELGHVPHEENPAESMQALAEFLSQNDPRQNPK